MHWRPVQLPRHILVALWVFFAALMSHSNTDVHAAVNN